MSVLDDLRAAQQRVTDRLAELEPLVKEYEELRAAAEKLGLNDAKATPEPTRRRRTAKSKRGRATSRTAKAETAAAKPEAKDAGQPRKRAGRRTSDGRVSDVQRLVAQKPGITIREVGDQLGVDPTSLYRPVKRLVADGKIRKDGRQLQPAE